MCVIIKRAVVEDIPVIKEMTLNAFKKYAADLGLPQQVKALKETDETIASDMENKNILMAFLNDRPVGSIRFEIVGSKVAYISRFGVDPNIHGKGIGKALLAYTENEVKKMGATLMALHTASKMAPQVGFYYKMGFYIHSTTHSRGYTRALFCKELNGIGVEYLNLVEDR